MEDMVLTIFGDVVRKSAGGEMRNRDTTRVVTVDMPQLLKKAAAPTIEKATKSAVDERETLIADYLHAHPAETRTSAVDAVYLANAGLYERCRREETVDGHGRTLTEIYDRATASFGVNTLGPIAKAADVTAEVARRAAMVVVKSASRTTLDAAIAATFTADAALYERWRRESRA